jgi:type II secretory pathway component GspD/PulD (secretin)
MEVHPEVSTGAVQITNNFTVPNKDTTQVTTNILVPDGATVIIGGLMREDLQTTSSQIPFLGNLPVIGAAFRNKIETTTKQEIIVLITPHIVGDYEVASEGQSASEMWRRRQRVVADNMNPLGNHSASQRWVDQARVACAQGDYARARKLAELAVRVDPNNVEAIALRDQLAAGNSGLQSRTGASRTR